MIEKSEKIAYKSDNIDIASGIYEVYNITVKLQIIKFAKVYFSKSASDLEHTIS
jgi:hypothetical protein